MSKVHGQSPKTELQIILVKRKTPYSDRKTESENIFPTFILFFIFCCGNSSTENNTSVRTEFSARLLFSSY